ncbi:hypothetical protein HRI_003925000 [Hibiscus trionum]|uniref:Uncharacterized protein n=1 Tax=Hibiscus trionum TaxID=183268 RepID=A0A9W7MFT9_HIBTR|nr:hypothetical protein HRI_003925000 [Hibiscus trionum]
MLSSSRVLCPDFEKCKPWLIKNSPELYPDLLKEASEKEAEKVSEQLQSIGVSSSADGAAFSARPGNALSSKQEDVKRLPGGNIKKKVWLLYLLYFFASLALCAHESLV